MIEPPECINLYPDQQVGPTMSPTSIDQFLNCEEKWRLSRVERLDPAVKAVPLEMGAAFAEATEFGEPTRGALRYIEAWGDARREHAGSPWATVPSAEKAEINAAIIEAAATAYLARYGPCQRREQTYRVPIRGGAHDLVCRVDGVDADGQALIEDKFTGRIDRANMQSRLRLDRQVSIEFYTHWRATGILAARMRYRMTLKCQLRRGRRESHDAFLDRIAADYVERPDHYLAEFPAFRSLDDFERLERELATWSLRLTDLEMRGGWTRNTSRCDDFAGCQFLPLCSGEPGAISQFRVRERSQPEERAAA